MICKIFINSEYLADNYLVGYVEVYEPKDVIFEVAKLHFETDEISDELMSEYSYDLWQECLESRTTLPICDGTSWYNWEVSTNADRTHIKALELFLN